MNNIINKRCDNPICGGNGNCATCPKRMSEQQNIDAFEAVTEYAVSGRDTADYDAVKMRRTNGADSNNKNSYAIAIDLGTTTLAFALVDKISDEVVHTITMLNSQRKYGADVLSRIQASVEGKREELRKSIQKDLCEGMDKLIKEYRNASEGIGLSKQQSLDIGQIVISGNTTMVHLLMGYDCSTLGVYPFTPVNTDTIIGTAEEILGYRKQDKEMKVTILSGISAYVGGDIVSGLYALVFTQTEKISLFVDLGTNGEIVLGNANRLLTTSVAAGPAFEGGNISCGTGSVAGAICAVKMGENSMPCDGDTNGNSSAITVEIKTIQNAPPCGICGTGVIEAVAELLKCGIVDETGLLADAYFDDGFLLVKLSEEGSDKESHMYNRIVITQQDIRQFQLAKAAVRTGIEILMKEYGITADKIDKVYIAGGFGYHLNVKKAAAIGLLPPELTAKAIAVGNTSLAGAVKYLSDKNAIKTIQRIKNASEDIILANDKDFQELYLKNTCLGY